MTRTDRECIDTFFDKQSNSEGLNQVDFGTTGSGSATVY